jgi:putative ABC transport system permease protein
VAAARLASNPVAIPPQAPVVGLVETLLAGAQAGVYPASRASRLPPAGALRTL